VWKGRAKGRPAHRLGWAKERQRKAGKRTKRDQGGTAKPEAESGKGKARQESTWWSETVGTQRGRTTEIASYQFIDLSCVPSVSSVSMFLLIPLY